MILVIMEVHQEKTVDRATVRSVSRRLNKKKKLNENERAVVIVMFIIAILGIFFSGLLPLILR